MSTFREIVTAEFGSAVDWNLLLRRQQELFITDAVDSLTEYVRSVGDARTDGGWNFS
jgi:hypothetical protein